MSKKIYNLIHIHTAPLIKGASKVFGAVCLGNEAPTSDVTVSFTSVNGYFTVPINKTFTTANFNVPQSITLTGEAIGAVEGKKNDTLIITASGGGYNLTKRIPIVVTDSGLDSQFLKGYNYLHGINIKTLADVATKRNILINGNGSRHRGIFNTAGLPTGAVPNSIDTNLAGVTTIGQTTVASLVGAAGVDRLTWSMLDGSGATWTNLVYHIRASSSNGRCVIVNGGHGSETEHLQCLNDLLANGYNILYAFMPSTFQNTETNASVTGTGVSAHNSLATGGVDTTTFMALELFFFDKVKSINYCIANFGYTSYDVTGCSGGGWAALVLMAMDTRIRRCIEIRGVKPIPYRAFTDESAAASWDHEQGPTGPYYLRNTTNSGTRVDALYEDVSFYDLMILASINNDGTPRRLHMTHHAADSCCHGKFTYVLWKDYLKAHIANLGGRAELTLSTDATYASHGFRANDRAIMINELTLAA